MPNYAKLKDRLKECGFSQTDLAKYMGLAQATVSQKLNGARPLSLEEAKLIAQLLEIPDAEFGFYFFSR